jgi:HSP20 family protein
MSSMITRWDPFRELSQLQERMDRLFRDNVGYSGGTREEALEQGSFIPPVDVYEDEHNITLKLEVPGVDQKDLDIRIENNTLTVRGERKLEKEEKQENFHRIERRYGSFVRTFQLPNTVDAEKVNANYDNGVLKITLAKKAEAKPKQIQVNVSGAPQKTIEAKGAGKAA